MRSWGILRTLRASADYQCDFWQFGSYKRSFIKKSLENVVSKMSAIFPPSICHLYRSRCSCNMIQQNTILKKAVQWLLLGTNQTTHSKKSSLVQAWWPDCRLAIVSILEKIDCVMTDSQCINIIHLNVFCIMAVIQFYCIPHPEIYLLLLWHIGTQIQISRKVPNYKMSLWNPLKWHVYFCRFHIIPHTQKLVSTRRSWLKYFWFFQM